MNIKRINNIFFLAVALLSVVPALIAGNRKGTSDTSVLASSLLGDFCSPQVAMPTVAKPNMSILRQSANGRWTIILPTSS